MGENGNAFGRKVSRWSAIRLGYCSSFQSAGYKHKVTALHEDYLSLKEHENSAGHREWTQALKEQRRRDFGKISAGQLMQLWSIAAREGPVWELLLKIISGQVARPALQRATRCRVSRVWEGSQEQ